MLKIVIPKYFFRLVTVKQSDVAIGEELANGNFSGMLGKVQNNDFLIIPRLANLPNRLSVVEFIVPVWFNQ